MKKLKITLMTISFIITVFLVNELSFASNRLSWKPQTYERIFRNFKWYSKEHLPTAMTAYYEENSYLIEEINKPYGDKDERSIPITKNCIISGRKIKHFLWKDIPHNLFIRRIQRGIRKIRKERKQENTEKKHKKGMVLIHGTGKAGWQEIVKSHFIKGKEREAIGEILIVHYDYTDGIKKSCYNVWEQIRNHFETDAKIVLVGHSQGGIIARTLVEHEAFAQRNNEKKSIIKAIFCLSAPLRGVPALNFLNHGKEDYPPSSRDMAVASRFIQELREEIKRKKEGQPQIFEIAADNDVIVDQKLCLTHASDVTESKIIPGGHFTATRSKSLWREFILPKAIESL